MLLTKDLTRAYLVNVIKFGTSPAMKKHGNYDFFVCVFFFISFYQKAIDGIANSADAEQTEEAL